MAIVLNISAIRKIAKQHDRRLGNEFANALNDFVIYKVIEACQIHNGGKKTLDKDIAVYAGINRK